MSRFGKILAILSGFVLVVVVVVFAAAWYYASAIKDQGLVVEREQDRFDLRVLSIEGGRITLEAAAEIASNGRWGEPGIWGLESADTYNQPASTGIGITGRRGVERTDGQPLRTCRVWVQTDCSAETIG